VIAEQLAGEPVVLTDHQRRQLVDHEKHAGLSRRRANISPAPDDYFRGPVRTPPHGVVVKARGRLAAELEASRLVEGAGAGQVAVGEGDDQAVARLSGEVDAGVGLEDQLNGAFVQLVGVPLGWLASGEHSSRPQRAISLLAFARPQGKGSP
jgi:hypothetical protein